MRQRTIALGQTSCILPVHPPHDGTHGRCRRDNRPESLCVRTHRAPTGRVQCSHPPSHGARAARSVAHCGRPQGAAVGHPYLSMRLGGTLRTRDSMSPRKQRQRRHATHRSSSCPCRSPTTVTHCDNDRSMCWTFGLSFTIAIAACHRRTCLAGLVQGGTGNTTPALPSAWPKRRSSRPENRAMPCLLRCAAIQTHGRHARPRAKGASVRPERFGSASQWPLLRKD